LLHSLRTRASAKRADQGNVPYRAVVATQGVGKRIFLPNSEINVITFLVAGSKARLAGTRSSKAKGQNFLF
jgi:hypothetical protein